MPISKQDMAKLVDFDSHAVEGSGEGAVKLRPHIRAVAQNGAVMVGGRFQLAAVIGVAEIRKRRELESPPVVRDRPFVEMVDALRAGAPRGIQSCSFFSGHGRRSRNARNCA